MKISYLSICLFWISCNQKPDYDYIKSKIWIHDKGFKIGKGDVVEFDSKQNLFVMKVDTIFYNGAPRALIKKLNKKYFELTVSSLNGKEIGSYVSEDVSFE